MLSTKFKHFQVYEPGDLIPKIWKEIYKEIL